MTRRLRSAAVDVHRRRDTVRGEHHDRALGHLVVVLDEDGTRLGQRLHHVAVVDDLVPHVHGCAVLLECAFDGFDGAIDACAVSAGLGQQHPLADGGFDDRAGGTWNAHVDRLLHGSQGTDPQREPPSRTLAAMATAPYGVRLLVGAAVTALDETRRLPQTILTYPMTVVSQVAQLVMKVQQDVADLVNRGDETLEQLFPPKDEQPEWATFDEDDDDRHRATRRRRARDGERLTEGRFALFSTGEPDSRARALDPLDRRTPSPPGIVGELDYPSLTLAQLRARLLVAARGRPRGAAGLRGADQGQGPVPDAAGQQDHPRVRQVTTPAGWAHD